jgi:hypothetical protein
LREFESRVLRKISGPRREKWQEAGEDCIIKNMTYILHKILLGYQIRRWEGHLAYMGEIRNAHIIFVIT